MNDQHDAVRQVKPLAFDFNEVSRRFIDVELDLAGTFCELGLVTSNKENARRNAANARKALSAAEKFAYRTSFGSSDKTAVSEKVARLTKLLSKLEGDLEGL